MNHILIVEDEEFLVRALKDNLEAEGYSTRVALNGEEAMQCIRGHRPDLILLDLLMPKQDGLYVLEQIKNNLEWKFIPVIVLSNLGGDEVIKRALDMGADDYFVKSQHPIEEVIEKVKEYLEGKKQSKTPLLPARELPGAKMVEEGKPSATSIAEEGAVSASEEHPRIVNLKNTKK